jgi:hypothetical protein
LNLWLLNLLSLFLKDLFHSSHLPVRQTDLDPMRVIRGFREYILDDTFRQFAATLVLLQNDEHGHAGFDICAGLSIHI